MPLLSLPTECFSDVLFFLDNQSLFKCLFVNRNWCKLSIPILWNDPFNSDNTKPQLINTLLSCLNEDEISSLVPYKIILPNNQVPLFEYGKFIKKICHLYIKRCVIIWIKARKYFNIDHRVQKLINVIYHMIMRQGSKLQEFSLSVQSFYEHNYDLPKSSIFTTYSPGITNLRALKMRIGVSYFNMNYQNSIEFLKMVSTFCNGIIDCDLSISRLNSDFVKPLLNIIKLQPLERMSISIDNVNEMLIKIIYALEFRSETLKELEFSYMDFQGIDFLFISKLECLEKLYFDDCSGFVSQHCEALSKKKLQMKELGLWHNKTEADDDVMKGIMNSLCNEKLLKLFLNIITPDIIRVIEYSCPNLTFLHIEIKIFSIQFLNSTIPLICELTSLKTLTIETRSKFDGDSDLIAEILGDNLTFVEYLFLEFYIGLPSFRYFTDNCKAKLKTLVILTHDYSRKTHLTCVNNYQQLHNSLNILGFFRIDDKFNWTNEELEIIDSLSHQGVELGYIVIR